MLRYLCSPYSSKDRDTVMRRVSAVIEAAARLSHEGHYILSPIAHSHQIAMMGAAIGCPLPTNWTYWREFDEKLIQACGEVWVLTLDGWEASVGVTEEIKIAKRLGKRVRYIQPGALVPTDMPTQAEIKQ